MHWLSRTNRINTAFPNNTPSASCFYVASFPLRGETREIAVRATPTATPMREPRDMAATSVVVVLYFVVPPPPYLSL